LEFRAEEYVLYPFTHSLMTLDTARGLEFAQFLAKDLPPYINSRYRTKTDRSNTFIGGSSFGGLISLTAALYYPDTFGGVLGFSNALWPGDYGLSQDYLDRTAPLEAHFYLDTGELEGLGSNDEYAEKNYRLFQQIESLNTSRTAFVFQKNASHNEMYWAQRFIMAIQWLLDPGKDQDFLLY
jgi:predicted alpha/beta superfamily hydrolase